MKRESEGLPRLAESSANAHSHSKGITSESYRDKGCFQ
jgi:hypothetical protein